jgi:hypothetical protein
VEEVTAETTQSVITAVALVVTSNPIRRDLDVLNRLQMIVMCAIANVIVPTVMFPDTKMASATTNITKMANARLKILVELRLVRAMRHMITFKEELRVTTLLLMIVVRAVSATAAAKKRILLVKGSGAEIKPTAIYVIHRYRLRENAVVLEIETEIIGIPNVEYVAGQRTKVKEYCEQQC